MFDMMVWAGTALSVIGLFGLIWCIIKVVSARKANLPDEELRAALQKVLPLNIGALLLSILGLMFVVLGIFLG